MIPVPTGVRVWLATGHTLLAPEDIERMHLSDRPQRALRDGPTSLTTGVRDSLCELQPQG
jgi:hypothetical protein